MKLNMIGRPLNSFANVLISIQQSQQVNDYFLPFIKTLKQLTRHDTLKRPDKIIYVIHHGD